MEWLIYSLLALLAVGAAAFFYIKRSQRGDTEEYFHMRCPSCERKLRQRVNRIGHKGQCPYCKHVFTLALPKPGEKL